MNPETEPADTAGVKPSVRRGHSQLGTAFDDVVTAARAGAPWALDRLFESLSRPVAGYLRALGAPEPDELTNDVFLRVFTNLGRFEGGEDRFRSWVFTIAHHRLIDDRRRLQRRPVTNGFRAIAEEAGGGVGDVEEEAMGNLGAEWVHTVIAALAPDQREVLLLRVVADLTVEQIAEVVGKTPGAVKALQRRALGALRQRLERKGVPL